MAFNDARDNVPQPEVATSQAPRARSDGVAQAIQGFGAIAGDVRKGFLVREFEQEQGNLVDSAAILEQRLGTAGVKESNALDLATTVGGDEVADINEKFAILSRAFEQGNITETAIKLEAETLLKKKINQAPGFAADFRESAARNLGFDPSGATLQAVISAISGADTQRAQTAAEKRADEARAISQILGVDEKTTLVRLTKSANLAATKELTDAEVAAKALSGPQIVQRGLEDFNGEAQILFAEVMMAHKASGGQGDPDIQDKIFRLRQLASTTIEENRKRMVDNNTGQFKPADINQVDSTINTAMDNMLASMENRDQLEFLTRNASTIDKHLQFVGARAFPVETIIKNVYGEAALGILGNALELAGGDPDELTRRARGNPMLQATLKLMSNRVPIIEGLDRLLTGNPTTWPQMTPEQKLGVKAVTDAGLNVAQHGSVEHFNDSLHYKRTQEQEPQRLMSYIATVPGSFEVANPVEQAALVEEVQTTQRVLLDKLTNELAGGNSILGFNNGKFELLNRSTGKAFDKDSFIGRSGANSSGGFAIIPASKRPSGEDTVNRLNATVLAMARNHRGVLRAIGVDESTFVNGMIREVTTNSLLRESNDPELSRSGTTLSDDQKIELADALTAAQTSGNIQPVLDAAEKAGLGKFDRVVEDLQAPKINFFLDPSTGQVVTQ